ncbi:MFS transporter, partial [Mesorhizobium sp. M7D.F.Ca.US.004.03.1.1]|uniref:MFS transporter n=1 Tax=Mesorhizobium sp. M7D.F.Ca.US.004.03.1.1 TaxID=2496702 RepID=UPI000FCBC475
MGQGTYRRLLKERRRDLSFGFLFFFLSCVGQTFFISNFGPTWREEFAVSDGLLGLCYFIATSLSALCLAVAGPLIDRTTLARYACGVVVFVACGCLIAAASPNIAVLCLALLMLRLGGQSLMIHVAMTSTARTFGNDKAKALALCIMGLGVAQAVTPGLLVIGIEAVGWRLSWVASGLVILCAGLAVVQLLPQSKTTANLSQGAKLPALAVLRDPRVIIS